jgi:uracil-DNA glycosylase
VNPQEVLAEVAREVAVCTKCPLYHSRIKAVPGEGPAHAEILLIGEGPGTNENVQGRPFVGAAGKFLDELLSKAGLKRADVFITNVVKCRPPENRDPEPDEISTCTSNYLQRQIAAINPRVIITLGRHSMGLFLTDARITRVHGQPVQVEGRLIVPMFHPAAALHQPALHDPTLADFAKLPQIIAGAKSAPKKDPPPSAAQSPHPAEKNPDDDNPPKGTPPVQLNLF